ncbi:TetR family transcriptional regulator [Pseudonocardia ailaonensis]|uniref:TetR family transcriptional regulator n=1 Tax=Pseudonocardia ailaonensis TaxID=367279 RepID=A0ABN2N8F5_9PSEU
MSVTQRARSASDKARRRADLLAAARGIALERSVNAVTLAAVTAAVGLHPSAVRRYFDSREEMLLELARDGWVDWRANLARILAGRRGMPADDVAEALSSSLSELPLFCDLLTHVVLSLEGAVRLERAREYKAVAAEAYDAMIDALVASASGVDRHAAHVAMKAAMSSGAFLFQLARPKDTLRELYEMEPGLARDTLDLRAQLNEVLAAVLRGLVES